MNIFVLDRNPSRAAHMMCDKHVVKMIIESAQMLSAVLDCQYRSDRRGGDGPVIKQLSLISLEEVTKICKRLLRLRGLNFSQL